MTYEEALSNPASVFASPKNVLESDLAREQKIRVLRQWEYDEREREVAEEENMGGGEADKLSGILKALDQLGDVSERQDGPTGKQGGE